MIDSIAEFFDGKYNTTDLLNLDIPALKALILGRAHNIKQASADLEKKKANTHVINKFKQNL